MMSPGTQHSFLGLSVTRGAPAPALNALRQTRMNLRPEVGTHALESSNKQRGASDESIHIIGDSPAPLIRPQYSCT